MAELVLSRRKFLVLGSSFMAVAATPSLATLILPKSAPRFSIRKLALYNIHTGETFEGTYWRESHYDTKALERLTHVLRDRRNNKKHPIDPRLFDALHRLQSKLGTKDPFQIICGYRSPETNSMLHKKNRGVAKNSLHVKGKAIDVNLGHVSLKELSNAARSLKVGGVGYYPKSNFVHIDIRHKPAFWT
jgi:uncharacterized protein YcbK (DUF882 family)